MNRRITSPRLPRSGNAALAAGALVQAALGLEFLFAGLSKAINPNYTQQFSGYVKGMPGATSGPLAAVIQALVVPNIELAAQIAKFTELAAGAVLLVTALEVARRRFSGPLGAEHGYEPLVALLSATAALAVAGLSATIYLIQGGRLPSINSGSAFSAPIAVELLVVPLALGVAWLEFGRFRALREARLTATPQP
jgi:hypothetical protein